MQDHRFSTNCTDLDAAALVLGREERVAQASSAYRVKQEPYTLRNVLDDLLSRGCLDCAADTVSFYRIKSGHVVRLLGGDLPLDRLHALLQAVRKSTTKSDEGPPAQLRRMAALTHLSTRGLLSVTATRRGWESS